MSNPYVGRFAPSPTGPLHFGSLLGALASFLDARARNGQWLVRIEDIDSPRTMPGAADAILQCLQAHGLTWNGEVLYQSQRSAIYRQAIAQLIEKKRAFFCTCSRTDLADNAGIYPGRCRHCHDIPTEPHSIRLQVDNSEIRFVDRIQGEVAQNMARDVGDFVIFRKEGLAAYQLAVVIDDAAQGVTHIVRGSDLLDSTPRQIYLQRALDLPTPSYAHIPVITNRAGQKLSKQTLAPALDNADACANLLAALVFLRQEIPPENSCSAVATILDWAIRHWRIESIPKVLHLSGDALPADCRRFAI